MIKTLYIILLASLCALFTSCSSVRVQKDLNGQNLTLSENFTPVGEITVDNYGYNLFWCIPIVAGSPADDGKITFFEGNVDLNKMTDVLLVKAQELGSDHVLNLTSRTKNLPTPLTFFTFSYVEVQVSGNAVKSK